MSDTAPSSVPCVVLGGSGYVAGELLRLLAGHPFLHVEAVVSESRAGTEVVAAFPQLRGTRFGDLRFGTTDELSATLDRFPFMGAFSALPHGESAVRIDRLLTRAAEVGCELRVVDLSADFRHADPALYESIYGRPHAAPDRLAEFHCGLPELVPAGPLPESAKHVAHPGCFTTAAVLALAPFVAAGAVAGPATVVAVTGSTGSGRAPSATTHHPERRSDLFAYSPLAHRHEAEMRTLLTRVGAVSAFGGGGGKADVEVDFLPHSGPFARGIHATIAWPLPAALLHEELRSLVSTFYGASGSSFVHLLDAPPRLQSVVGTNRCDLFVAQRGDRAIVCAAIDNLVKGAAGGAVQWMNRLFDRPDASGLELPGLGWL